MDLPPEASTGLLDGYTCTEAWAHTLRDVVRSTPDEAVAYVAAHKDHRTAVTYWEEPSRIQAELRLKRQALLEVRYEDDERRRVAGRLAVAGGFYRRAGGSS
eukprot:3494676-Pleurochrysis_carterae.AAC.1